MIDNITIGNMKELKDAISKVASIGEWKTIVADFRDRYKLTDTEAINIANNLENVI